MFITRSGQRTECMNYSLQNSGPVAGRNNDNGAQWVKLYLDWMKQQGAAQMTPLAAPDHLAGLLAQNSASALGGGAAATQAAGDMATEAGLGAGAAGAADAFD